MDDFIKLEYIPYEDELIKLKWHVSNGNTSTKAEYYHDLSSLVKIADHLEMFPRHSSDVFLHDFGSERPEDKAAYYFRFRAFLHNPRGGCSLLFRFNNNQQLPKTEITEFCIQDKEPAEINALGKMFRRFSKLENEVMLWSSNHQFIGNKSDMDINEWRRLNA